MELFWQDIAAVSFSQHQVELMMVVYTKKQLIAT